MSCGCAMRCPFQLRQGYREQGTGGRNAASTSPIFVKTVKYPGTLSYAVWCMAVYRTQQGHYSIDKVSCGAFRLYSSVCRGAGCARAPTNRQVAKSLAVK